jgi:predicted nucleic acid-binding protein
MKFWDSSAVVPLLVAEARSASMSRLLESDPVQLVWWATEVECASALARLEHDGQLDDSGAREAFDRLNVLRNSWHEIQATEAVRRIARRLLRTHRLRVADALQLAAALVGSDDAPSSLEVVTLDERLVGAAEREGLRISTT